MQRNLNNLPKQSLILAMAVIVWVLPMSGCGTPEGDEPVAISRSKAKIVKDGSADAQESSGKTGKINTKGTNDNGGSANTVDDSSSSSTSSGAVVISGNGQSSGSTTVSTGTSGSTGSNVTIPEGFTAGLAPGCSVAPKDTQQCITCTMGNATSNSCFSSSEPIVPLEDCYYNDSKQTCITGGVSVSINF